MLVTVSKAIYCERHLKPEAMVPVQRNFRVATLTLVVLLAAGAVIAQHLAVSLVWIATWGTAQQIPEPHNALPNADLQDTTLRQVFRVSVGGSTLRVHFSNEFGTEPLQITAAHIALPIASSISAIDPATDKPLLFGGRANVLIPPGAEWISDPIDFAVPPLASVSVTFHLDAPPSQQTGHPGSRATSYYVHGDAVAARDLIGAKQIDHWYLISGIDVLASPGAGSVIALGDSITDGHGATTNGNDRWTDVLANRLQASPATRKIGVSNRGIGGNHLLTDGLGPNVLSRLDRDVLSPAGAHWLIVFEGVNDLGALARDGEVSPQQHEALVARVLAAYRQIIDRAHARGMRVYGATITPYIGSGYYHPGPLSESDRQSVNRWIRERGHFDAVIDFDAVVRDPQHPDRLLPAFDCGDHLHPSPAGYKAMGEAVPLQLFATPPGV